MLLRHIFHSTYKKVSRSLSMMTVLAVIFSLLGPAILLAPLPALAAATVDVNAFGLTNGNFPGAPIKASSAATAIVKLKINPTVTTTLGAVTAAFSFSDSSGSALAAALATTTLAAIATDDTSGVALYKDNTSGGTADNFDGTDTVVTLATISGSGWTGMTSTITLTPAATPPTLTGGINNVYFLVIKTSSSAANGTRIAVTIPTTSVATAVDVAGVGPSSAFTANYLQVDTVAPTIASATGYVGQTGVTVTFSEPVQKTGGGNLAYTAPGGPFTIASSTIASISHTAGSNIATLTMTPALAAGDLALSSANTIRASSTTSTITDMAGNNMTANPVAFTSPLSISTASIPSTYVGAVYGASNTLVTFAAAGGASATYTWMATSTSPTALSALGLSLAATGADAGKLTGTVASLTGSYGIAIDVGDGTSTTTKNFIVNISATNVSGVPGITQVSPPGGAQNATSMSVTITGVNTGFTNSSVVAFSLPVGSFGANSITLGTVVRNSATSITVPVTIADGATIGNRDVKVTTGTEVAFMPNGFGVGAAGGAGLNLLFPASGATGVQIPPGFNFTPSANTSFIAATSAAYRVTVKSTSDFSGAAVWDYAFPKPNADFSNGSHCNASSCNLSYGAGAFKIITQPGALNPGATYYWKVNTYAVSTDLLSATDTQVPIETTASRSFTISSSIADTSPPSIQHRPVFLANPSTDANLYARVIDNLANASTTPALATKIFYCAGAGCAPSSNTTGTSVGSGYYNFTIPGATVSSAGTVIRYYLRADDGTNLSYASQGTSATSTPPYQFTVAASAGTANAITGFVKDTASTPNNLTGALVFAEGTGFVAATSAATTGAFTFGAGNILLAGTYDLTAFKTGYADRSITGIPAATTALTFNLAQGGGGGFGGDTTKPHVKFNGPMDGMGGIPGGDSNFKIFVVFDKTMSQSAVATSTTMQVKQIDPATGLATDITTSKGSWTYYSTAPAVAGLPPEANMAVWSFSGTNTFGDGKTIAVVVTPNVTDTAGNSIAGNQSDGSYVFSFTTGSTANFTGFNSTTGGFSGGGTFGTGAFMPPRVIGTTPPPGAFAVPTNTKVVINFSDAMADDSGTSYVLKNYVKLYTVSGTTETDISTTALSTVTLDSAKLNATITLSNSYNSGAFAASSNYRLKVLGGAKSASGMTLAQPGQETTSMFMADFKTGTGADTGTPTVVGVYPTNGATSVPVNVGAINAGFNKDMSSSTITSSTFYLSLGSTAVNGSVDYRSLERQAYFIPKAALSPNTTYTLNVLSTIQGLNSQAVTATSTVFTTGAADGTKPKVSFVSADDYNLAITFNEPMNSAKATDTFNWDSSVLNPLTYDVLKSSATAGFATSTAGTSLSLTGATLTYDAVNNTVNIKGVSLTAGQELYISFDSTGSNIPKDLSGNAIETAGLANTSRTTVKSSATTKGMLGPGAMTGDAFSSGGGFTPTNFSSTTFGFAPKVEVRPFNTMAGQSTVYGVRLPISKQIPSGGTVVLTFPSGFDVTSARQDVNSPGRKDLNGPATGTIRFRCNSDATANRSCGGSATNSAETGSTEGGLSDDGVSVDVSARTVTVYISGATNSEGHDFLSIDIAGIKNSTVPKDFNTSGYTVDVKTKDGSTILDSLTSSAFFIQSAGTNTLSGTITATSNNQNGTMKVYLMSPMTGPLDATSANFSTTNAAAYSFSNIPNGDYMLFTDQTITLGSLEYVGKTIPERITISGNTTYDFTIGKTDASGTAVTVNITGGPASEPMDVFAGSPNGTGFKAKQVTLDGSGAGSVSIYLTDGKWFVGAGPQMPKGFVSGPPPTPTYMPPKPVDITIAGSACTVNGTVSCTMAFTLATSDKTIKGTVKDGSSKVIANAQVYAYSASGGFGTNTQADGAGAFTLNVVAGTYSVGAFVPGMPPSKEVSVTASTSASNYLFIDGAQTGISPTTAATTFILKLAKPDYTISGKVTDGTNVIQGANVYTYRTDGPGHANANTDSSGNYTLYVANGTWKVGSFLPQYGQLTEQTVTVASASQSNINFAPSGTGTFHVVSGNVKVATVNRQGAFVRLSGNGTFNEAITDSSGNYNFNVPEGNGYILRVFVPGVGESAPLTAFNILSSDTTITGKDFAIGAGGMRTVTFAISPATTTVTKALIDLFTSTGIGGHAEITNATSTTMSLPDGNYTMRANIAGINIGLTDISGTGYTNTTGVLAITGDVTVTITLPTLRTVSGTVKDSSAVPVPEAWVDLSNPTTGVHFGAKSGSDGTFSLKVADSSSSYFINAMKPGYFRQPASLTVNGSNQTGQTLTIASASITIGGTITAGGAVAANAFVRADKQGGGFSGTQADANGVYSLPVNAGTWSVYAVSEGYAEARYSSVIDVSTASVTGKDIALTTTVALNAPKSKPIIPDSGGTLEDTTAGVKLTIPAKALGSSTASGNIEAKETNNVRSTDSATPLGGKAKEIKATDSFGNLITTNFNSSVTVEMNYTKAELAATASASDSSIDTNTEADKLKMAYWDETTGNWVTMPSTITYKDASGNVITDSTTIDTAAEFTANVASVTIAATTDHFSLFAPVVGSDPTPASVPSGLAGTGNLATEIDLTWTAVSGATGYDVYRSTTENGTYGRLGSEPTTTGTSYNNTGLSAATTYYYKVTAIGASGESSASAAISAWTAGSSTTSGGAITSAPVASSPSAPATPATPAKTTTPAPTTTPASASLADNLARVRSDAAAIATGLREAILAQVGKIRDTKAEGTFDKSVVSKVVAGIKTITAASREKILNFVTYGTPTTDALGAGERGGVVNSFKEAFGKLPETDKDWEDVVKIGNGRWPSQTNKTKEDKAIASFRSVYKRAPDRTKPNDDAAIVVMAYGLRPRDRNLASEAAAIKTYRAVFNKVPTTATAWDAVRAIAYSGAKR